MSFKSILLSKKWCAGALAGLLVCSTPAAQAAVATWVPGAGGSWNTTTNWDTGVIPNAPGDSAIFNSPTATRTVTVDSGATGFTAGSISFDVGSTFSNSITTGTAGSNLKLDGNGSAATITATGGGTGNNTISAGLVLNGPVTAIVNSTTASSAAGTLNLTATISGAGSFTKQGPGLMTFGTGAKTYTGATLFDTNSGRTRISVAASPTATSSMTVKSGSQLELITAGTYTFGSGNLNLNGTGPGAGSPQAAFLGVIRNTRDLAVTIANPVVLQSDSIIHVQASPLTLSSTFTAFSNTVSGPGGLIVTAPNSDANIGQVILGNVGSFTGSTVVNAGTLKLDSSAGPALGGTSGITVGTQVATSGGAIGVLLLNKSDQINNSAPLTLTGGTFNTAGNSEGSFDGSGKGVAGVGPLTVSANSLIDLGGSASVVAFATSSGSAWGSNVLNVYNWSGNPDTGAGADRLFFGSDATGLAAGQLADIKFYSDAGLTQIGTSSAILSTGEVVPVVNGVPEPGSLALIALGALGLIGRRRRR